MPTQTHFSLIEILSIGIFALVNVIQSGGLGHMPLCIRM